MILPQFWRSKSEISITLDPNQFQEGHVSFGDYRCEPVPCPFQLVMAPNSLVCSCVSPISASVESVTFPSLFCISTLALPLSQKDTVMAFKSRRDNPRQTLHLKNHSNHKSKDPFFLVK